MTRTTRRAAATDLAPGRGDAAVDRVDTSELLVRAVELTVELVALVAELETRGAAEAKQARQLIAALLARPRRGQS